MKKIFIYTMMLGCTLLASSCNDWLDVKPQAQIESEDLFKKPKGFEDALVACYIKMNSTSLYGRAMTMTATEFLAQFWDHTSGNYRDEDKLKNFEYKIEYAETTFSAIYGEMFNVIAQANSVLENLETKADVVKDPDIRNIIKAEALGIRAFCHTDILRLFGQMPVQAIQQVQLPYAKTVSIEMVPYYAYNDYVNLILADIEAAQLLFKESDPVMTYTFKELDEFTNSSSKVELKETFLGYRRFRFNYYAMEALKARLYMYKGDKAKAFEAANNVIIAKSKTGEPILSLAGNDDFTKKYYAQPSECILALSNSQIKEDTKNLFGNNYLYLTKTHYQQLFTGQVTSTNNRALHVWNSQTDNQGTFKALLKKYDQPENDNSEKDTDKYTKFQVIPLLRLSEMYLIAIECANSLAESNTLYTTYMAARDVQATPLTAESLQNEVLNEYRREFFGEGQMFYTYKRTATKKMMWKTDREVTEKDYIVPLPTSELGSN